MSPVLSSNLSVSCWRAGVIAALIGAALSGCDRQSGQQAQPAGMATSSGVATSVAETGIIDRSHHGARMPDLTVHDGAGHELRLVKLAGTPVLVNLWATWCAACVVELPALNALAAKGVRVVAVSEDTGRKEAVSAFLAAHHIDRLGAWLDPEGDVSGIYKANDLPMTVYYGSDGREIWRFTGGNDWAGAKGAALLAEARK